MVVPDTQAVHRFEDHIDKVPLSILRPTNRIHINVGASPHENLERMDGYPRICKGESKN